MTTAALLQATSVITNVIVSSSFTMAGAPGGRFDATPTTTIVSVWSATSVGTPAWVSASRTITSSALAASGVGTPAFTGAIVAVTTVSAVWSAAGSAGIAFSGFNGGTPTTTISAALAAVGVGTLSPVSTPIAFVSAVLSAPSVAIVLPVSQAITVGVMAGRLGAVGVATLFFNGVDANAPIPPSGEAIPVRFTTGPKVAVIPIEVVGSPGVDVIEVRLRKGSDKNYTNVVVDPTHPLRKKVHFQE